jgi:hypothetical protein
MARPKGSKNVDKKEVAEKSVEIESPVVASVPPVGETPAPAELAGFPTNRWIYSETEEPRILKAGTPMPVGFQDHAKFEKIVWVVDGYGKWSRKNK